MRQSVIDVAATCRNLKELIEEQKYTPMEIQHVLGLNSVQSVYKWYSRNNRTIPSLDNLVMLSELLGCTLEDILVLKSEIVLRRKKTMTNRNLQAGSEEVRKECLSRSVIEFGFYYQGVDKSFGKQPIEWIPLEYREDGTVLLISREVIDCKEYDEDVTDWQQTWENCSLRKWLNDSFLKEAFSSEEQEKIQEVRNINADNATYETPGGNDTYDKVFLLSVDEFEKYCPENDFAYRSSCLATKYAKARGVKVSRDYTCSWWLRTPGLNMYGAPPSAVIVKPDGKINKRGEFMEICYGVRPAIVLDLKAGNDSKYSKEVTADAFDYGELPESTPAPGMPGFHWGM